MKHPDHFDLDRLREIPDPLDPNAGAEAGRLPEVGPRAPTRRAYLLGQGLALAVSLFWVLMVLAVFGPRPDLDRLPAAFAFAAVGLPLCLSVAAVLTATRGGAHGLGIGRSRGLALGAAALLAFFVAAALGPFLHPMGHVGGRLPGYFVCALLTSVLAAIPFAATMVALRRAFPAGARWRSALLGLGVGLLAGAAINAECDDTHVLHVALGHGLPIAASFTLGALVLARRARA